MHRFAWCGLSAGLRSPDDRVVPEELEPKLDDRPRLDGQGREVLRGRADLDERASRLPPCICFTTRLSPSPTIKAEVVLPAYTHRVIAARAKVFAAQLFAFSAVGWLVAGILDAAGVFRLSDALVVSGLLLGDHHWARCFPGWRHAAHTSGISDPEHAARGRGWLRRLPSGAKAFAVVSACVAAVGLSRRA